MGPLFTALGYVTGAAVFFLEARRRGRASADLACVALAALAGGITAAKAAEWTAGAGRREPRAALAAPGTGGRTLVGAVVGGWIAVAAARRQLGVRRPTGDMFALALPAGEAVGRLGCYFNECCVGAAAAVPWAVYQQGEWRHPAQMYQAAAAAAILGILLLCRDRMPREGDLFRLYLVLFGTARVGIELVRDGGGGAGGLSTAQWVCAALAAAGAVSLRRSAAAARAATGMAGAGKEKP